MIHRGPRERQSDKWTWMTFAGPGMLSSHAGVSILTLLWGTSSFQVSGQMSWMELTAYPPPRVAKSPIHIFHLMNDADSQSLIPVNLILLNPEIWIGTIEKQAYFLKNPAGRLG